jgi:8-oxo-dGTP pyrophosphatase MutT (NUDIX family)
VPQPFDDFSIESPILQFQQGFRGLDDYNNGVKIADTSLYSISHAGTGTSIVRSIAAGSRSNLGELGGPIQAKIAIPMNSNTQETTPAIVRYGAVAVVVRDRQLLIIRRSQHIIAPGMYCFPGGGIEPGETEQQAVVRELREELNCTVVPRRRLWEHISSWGIHLTWWLADLEPAPAIVPNPQEVESVHWFTIDELKSLPNQLESNYRFVEAMERGEFTLEELATDG